jgi:hypothetical protein
MADAMTVEAPVVVDAPPAGTTGQPQGAQAPSLSKLYDQLPEATRKQIKAERFAPLQKLDNLVAEIQRLDGEVGNGIRVPGKDATKEQIAKYRKEAGIPDAPEGYALTRPQLPNGLPYAEHLERWFRKELFDAGVPQAAAERIFNSWNATQIAAFSANQKALEDQRVSFAKQALESLQAKYKDELPKMMQLRDAAIARFGGQQLVEAFRQARLPNGMTMDNDPRVNEMLIQIGMRMDADTMVAGDTHGEKIDARPGLTNPVTGQPIPSFYPSMEKDPRFRVKAE